MISVNHLNLLTQEKENEKKMKQITKVNKKESSTRRKKVKINKFLAIQKLYSIFLTNLDTQNLLELDYVICHMVSRLTNLVMSWSQG